MSDFSALSFLGAFAALAALAAFLAFLAALAALAAALSSLPSSLRERLLPPTRAGWALLAVAEPLEESESAAVVWAALMLGMGTKGVSKDASPKMAAKSPLEYELTSLLRSTLVYAILWPLATAALEPVGVDPGLPADETLKCTQSHRSLQAVKEAYHGAL